MQTITKERKIKVSNYTTEFHPILGNVQCQETMPVYVEKLLNQFVDNFAEKLIEKKYSRLGLSKPFYHVALLDWEFDKQTLIIYVTAIGCYSVHKALKHVKNDTVGKVRVYDGCMNLQMVKYL